MTDESLRSTHAPSAIDVDALIAHTVHACKFARSFARAVQDAAERRLRAIREAGRCLALVQRSHGGRPTKNSSSGLTSYQEALSLAGISRETARVWQRVAAISDAEFEGFIDTSKRSGGDLTMEELFRAATPSPSVPTTTHAVMLRLSAADRRTFRHRVGVLGAAYFASTASETVLAVLERAYQDWCAAQHQPTGWSSGSHKTATDRHG